MAADLWIISVILAPVVVPLVVYGAVYVVGKAWADARLRSLSNFIKKKSSFKE